MARGISQVLPWIFGWLLVCGGGLGMLGSLLFHRRRRWVLLATEEKNELSGGVSWSWLSGGVSVGCQEVEGKSQHGREVSGRWQ